MSRNYSHFENREPILEKYLCELRFRRIIRHIPHKSKVLDLGCGYNGKLLKKISHRIDSGYGIDLSVNQNCIEKNIKLIKHDLSRHLPFKNDEFDVVTSLANLEHLENPEKALREIYRVLKPSGILLLTVPTTYSKPVLEFLSFRLHLISEDEIKDHKQYTNKKILACYCEKIGFSSWRHKYFQFFMNNFLYAKK